MGSKAKRRAENVSGSFFVDSTCIDCDTCRWMAPETFDRAGSQSRVHTQPTSDEAVRRAAQALLACPTFSIGSADRSAVGAAIDDFPLPVDGPVAHCGFHAESSFGAAAYVVRRAGGNVLVDSPRFTAPLVRKLEEFGGLSWLFLTHRDDVADHEKFAAHFGCTRVLHEDDLSAGTRDVEHVITGGDDVALSDDLVVIPTPGHTRGSACLHHDRYLFTGDHLAWSARLEQLYAFRTACWYDWDVQVASMEKLVERNFEWVLPGHGHRRQLAAGTTREEMARCVAWMRS